MHITSREELEDQLSTPSNRLLQDLQQLKGDIMVLGAGGKMGPSLTLLARRAFQSLDTTQQVYAVSRFSDAHAQPALQQAGIHTIQADLLDDTQLQQLPDVPNILYLAGTKFGTTGNESLTWAMNTYLPGRVAERFQQSRMVVFSTGNVYPLTPVAEGGAHEATPTAPIGEYAQSCLGRERMFEYFSHKYRIPALIFRLNYAIDLRYGVLYDIAQAVYQGDPIDLSMGYVNVIWQGDANEIALRSLLQCQYPLLKLNVTGPEMVAVKWLANQFATRFQKTALFTGQSKDTALISNAAEAMYRFGYPKVSLRQMIDWTAHWIQIGGQTLGKPTHFQERTGNF